MTKNRYIWLRAFLDRSMEGTSAVLSQKLPTGVDLTKAGAATNQVMAAIEMFLRSRYECAITLAGAAEGMLPKTPHSTHAMHLAMELPEELANDPYATLDRKQRIAFWNVQRDWLKHANPDMPDEMTISRIDAESMIVRALTHLPEPEFGPENVALLQAFFDVYCPDVEWSPPKA